MPIDIEARAKLRELLRMPPDQRFWAQLEKRDQDECWPWTGAFDKYGRIRVAGRQWMAHRYAYFLHHGSIDSGLVIDHICRNHRCVNPRHLELVPNRVNILRGVGISAENARKTACPKSHPYDEVNTYTDKRGKRHCRRCNADAAVRTYRKSNPLPEPPK